MADLVERDKAIEAFTSAKVMPCTADDRRYNQGISNCIALLKGMPSAQPEIIRCKDCRWYELPSHRIFENCVRWMESNCILLPIKPDDFCSRAERRTDG